jgi:metacaspase-1
MRQALSLHIGMNAVDPNHYGSDCPLTGCINDAKAMQAIANKAGFKSELLTNQTATSTAISAYLVNASRTLGPDDTLLVTFAGHGMNVPDENNDEKPNGFDQTWCVYDRMIVDDELFDIFAQFAADVRIVIVSDSCHSATIARTLEVISRLPALRGLRREIAGSLPLIGERIGRNLVTGYRTLPNDARALMRETHAEFYSSIQQQTVGSERAILAATVLTLSACKDDEPAADGEANGLYTSKLLEVWNGGAFQGTYLEFQTAIADLVGDDQNPQYVIMGRPNGPFEREQPFTSGVSKTDPGELPVVLEALKIKLTSAELAGREAVAALEDCIARLSKTDVLAFLGTDGAAALIKELRRPAA